MSFGSMNGESYFCFRRPTGNRFHGSALVVFAREAIEEAKPGSFEIPEHKLIIHKERKKQKKRKRESTMKVYPNKDCIICNKSFTPKRVFGLTCGDECSRQRRYNMTNEANSLRKALTGRTRKKKPRR
jgi:hypothetical protein